MLKFLYCFLVCLLCACQGPQKPERSEGKPLVLVSIAPYAYFVEKIAGDRVQVVSIVPPGVNMHTYEPTIHELTLAQQASVWFLIGEPFEGRVANVLKQHQPKLQLVELWKNVDLISGGHEACGHSHEEGEEAKDMHTWTSPKIAMDQVRIIAETLSELIPESSQDIALNLQALESELEGLDQEIHQLLEPIKGSAILVSHPAYGYFCREFDLVQLSIECSGKDPRPRDVERIMNQASEYKVRLVLTQLGYNNKGAELIAEKLQLPIYLVDPYARDYVQNMRYIAGLIAK